MKLRTSTSLLGIAAALLLATGAVALWAVADDNRASATAPSPAVATMPEPKEAALVAPPAPSAKSREEKRFSRADRDDDGLISQAEYLSTRRRNYDKLDANADGQLSFDEYAASGIAKFSTADFDRNGTLVATEYASTAPKPRKPVQTAANCECASTRLATAED